VVFVTGEAGQGKTALLREFVRRAQSDHTKLVVAWGHGNAHTGVGDPYLPFREVLGALAGDVERQWQTNAMEPEQARRLWAALPLTARAVVEMGPGLLNTFVSADALLGQAAAMATITPGKAEWPEQLKEMMAHRAAVPDSFRLQQSDLFEQYTCVMREIAEERPLVVVLDDLQWADVGTAGLLFHLGRRIEGSRILVVGAYRPTEVAMGYPTPSPKENRAESARERHPLLPVVGELKRHFGEIEVDLGQAEGRAFVEAFVDTIPNRLSGTFREMLYRQTLGHPLFTVELVRGMQERGDLMQREDGKWEEAGLLDWETLPARVEAVIGERVGRLSETSRRVLQVASVEGETFTAEVVARVRGMSEQEMVERLSGPLDREQRLVWAQGLERLGGRGTTPGRTLSRYRFRHILFQRYFYNNLDPVERAHLHEGVGKTLEQLYAEAGEETSSTALPLSRHFREAGILEKAVDYLREAGERAVRLSAHKEAVTHYKQALALLEEMTGRDGKDEARSLEQHMERARQELMLRVGLAVPLQALRGYADPAVGHLCDQARELCGQVGETPYLLPVLWHLAFYYNVLADTRVAYELGEQLLELSERAKHSLAAAAAHFVIGHALFMSGEWVRSRVHMEQAVELCRVLQEQQSTTFLYGHDIGVASLSGLCADLTILGYPDQGLARGQEALARAEELSFPLSLVTALGILSLNHLYCRRAQEAWDLGKACDRLSVEHGFVYWAAVGRYCCSWALIEQGRVEEGTAQIRQVIVDTQATGCKEARTLRLTTLAEAYGKMGRIKEGLDLLKEALMFMCCTGERVYESEIYRTRGELLLMQGEEEEAESCFGHAIEVADQLDAMLWVLRATVSLCRLWQQQGRREEARERLARIYAWFTEGFDAPDLLEAKALLEELA
jgi:tetratricopeptide (TPR) repeat protein